MLFDVDRGTSPPEYDQRGNRPQQQPQGKEDQHRPAIDGPAAKGQDNERQTDGDQHGGHKGQGETHNRGAEKSQEEWRPRVCLHAHIVYMPRVPNGYCPDLGTGVACPVGLGVTATGSPAIEILS